MNLIYNLFPSSIVEAIGWTIFHSLWQGALIAIVFGLTILVIDSRSARFRYALGIVSLIILLISSVMTFANFYSDKTNNSINIFNNNHNELSYLTNPYENTATLDAPKTQISVVNDLQKYFANHLGLIVNLWIIGLFIFSLRYFGGLMLLRRLRARNGNSPGLYWHTIVLNLKEKAKVKKTVEILESAFVKMPVVIGYIKPVILMPIGMLGGLPANQIEAIIAHEIAHIKRYDFIVNLFQTFIETIFFYHPAVWWISSIVRYERENCCDDIAVDLCGDPITYSRALVNIRQMTENESSFVLAVVGTRNQLFRRIKRMNSENKTRISYGIKFVSFALLALIISAASLYSTKTENASQSNINTASFANPLSITTDENNSTTIDNSFISIKQDTSYIKKGKRTFRFSEGEDENKVNYKAKLKDGKLEELYKDGEKIPDGDLRSYDAKVNEKIEEYDSLIKDIRKNREEYRDIAEEYRDKTEDFREKMRSYRNYRYDSDDFRPDLSELREAMRELRHELRNEFSGHPIHIPPINIPEIDMPDIDVDLPNIPPIHVPPIHIPPINIPALPKFDNEKWHEWQDELNENMKEFNDKMKHFDWNMNGFNDSMKVFGEKMKVFKTEMRKFGQFMRDAKDEMISDGLINDKYDLDSFMLSENKMEINGKTVSPELRDKYLRMYEDHTGKKLMGDHKIKINE